MFLTFQPPIPNTFVMITVVIVLLLLNVAESPLLVLVPPGQVFAPVLQLFSNTGVLVAIHSPSVGVALQVALAARSSPGVKKMVRTVNRSEAVRIGVGDFLK